MGEWGDKNQVPVEGSAAGVSKTDWQVRVEQETKGLGEMPLRARVFLSLSSDCTPSDAERVCGSLLGLFSFYSSRPSFFVPLLHPPERLRIRS